MTKDDGMTYTPGPWTHYDDATTTARHEIAASGKTVARVYCTKGDEVVDHANARLIAAAPDLLEALETIMLDCQTGNADISDTAGHAMRTAVAKARGPQS